MTRYVYLIRLCRESPTSLACRLKTESVALFHVFYMICTFILLFTDLLNLRLDV